MNNNEKSKKQRKDGISVIIPIFNEKKTIAELIQEIDFVMKTSGYYYEIIAVNDFSTDETGKILDSLQTRTKNLKVIHHQYNKGYGASLKTGINFAKNNLIAMLDGDGTYLPQDILKLIHYSKDYDLVSGARVGKRVKIPLLRIPAKFILTILARILTGIRIPDLNCGLRIIKKDNIKKFYHLLPQRFSFTMTHLLACLSNGYEVKFVPINYKKRKGNSSIHPLNDFIKFISIIIRIITYFNPFKMFSLISFAMFLLAMFVWFYTIFYIGKIADISVIVLLISSLQIFLFGLLADLIVKNNIKENRREEK
ncbi:glycosyltransferase family 2 protein [Candidatus Woesearchaeota archaeon]|nr:glycosyltransferase family 2 protein [Candidatus Woesearchaeota archaeon]